MGEERSKVPGETKGPGGIYGRHRRLLVRRCVSRGGGGGVGYPWGPGLAQTQAMRCGYSRWDLIIGRMTRLTDTASVKSMLKWVDTMPLSPLAPSSSRDFSS